jgi:hypothetical protein
MAGTLTISTLSDGTNSTSSTNCIQGSAKAWARFAGASGTIAASYNVSSITRAGTGQYFVNFTNALTDANYSAVVSASNSTGSNWVFSPTYTSNNSGVVTAPTTSGFYITTVNTSFAYVDATYVNLSVFR